MEAKHVFFADESGNAGINYLDGDQPYHVSAGWLVQPDMLPAFEAVIRKEFGSAASECKGGSLVKTGRGQKRVRAVIEKLRELAEPFFIVYERRFSIAGKIQSVYFDAANNDTAHWIIPGDAAHELEVAEELYAALPSLTLDRFAKAYRQPSVEGFSESAHEIERHLRKAGKEHLAQTMLGAVANIAEIARAENYADVDEGIGHAEWASLNVPAVVQLVRKVDSFMDRFAPARFDVVHDNTRQFDRAIRRGIEMVGAAGVAHDGVMSGGRMRRFALGNWNEVRMMDSKETPGVQAADLLAATVRYLVSVFSAGKVPGGELRKLARLTFIELEGEDPPRAGIYMDRAVLKEWSPRIRSTFAH